MNNQDVIRPAGFWIRLLASLLDNLILSVPFVMAAYLYTGATGTTDITDITDTTGTMQGNPYITILAYVASFLYSVVLPVIWSGYTIGKRICQIRIVKITGEKLGIGTMLLRSIVGGLVYALTLGIAAIVSAIMVGVRKDKRAIHDFIAGTYVTYEKP